MTQYAIAKTHDEWLEMRSKGLGGSDIGTVLGFNKHCTPYQLWLEKTGQYQPPDISDKIAIQIGNALEDLVAKLFTQATGLEVQKDNKTHYHKDYPFLLANIDRKIKGQRALLECKTTNSRFRQEWIDEEVPASYLLQVQHYLNVLDYDTAYIAVIIGNSEFIWKEIKRDQQLIDMYTEKAVEFWEENVVGMKEPEIDGSLVTREAIEIMYGDDMPSEETMTAEQIRKVESVLQLKEDIKALESMKTTLENELKRDMGVLEVDTLIDSQYRATWKKQRRTRIDEKLLKKEMPEVYDQYKTVSEFKVLRVKEIEE